VSFRIRMGFWERSEALEGLEERTGEGSCGCWGLLAFDREVIGLGKWMIVGRL